MSINKKYLALLLVLTFCFVNNLHAQTSDWKIVWDRNPQSDDIGYYVIYREIDSAPTINSTIVAQIQDCLLLLNHLKYEQYFHAHNTILP